MQPCTEQDHIRRIAIEVGRHSERLADLEDHRKRQNGTLQRIEDKITKVDDRINALIKVILTTTATMLGGFLLGMITWLIQRG